MTVAIGTRMIPPEESGLVRVTIQCGCGLEITAIGTPDESHHDIYDRAERELSNHLDREERDGICRPWMR